MSNKNLFKIWFFRLNYINNFLINNDYQIKSLFSSKSENNTFLYIYIYKTDTNL